MGDHELIDAEDLATGNEEDDNAILRLLENKQKETQARMDRIDQAFNQLRMPRRHDGKLTKKQLQFIDWRVQEIEHNQKRYLHMEKMEEQRIKNSMKEEQEIALDGLLTTFEKQREYTSKEPRFLACTFSSFGKQILCMPFCAKWGAPWLSLTQDGTLLAWEKPSNEALQKSIRKTIEEFSMVNFQTIPLIGNVQAVFEDKWGESKGLMDSDMSKDDGEKHQLENENQVEDETESAFANLTDDDIPRYIQRNDL